MGGLLDQGKGRGKEFVGRKAGAGAICQKRGFGLQLCVRSVLQADLPSVDVFQNGVKRAEVEYDGLVADPQLVLESFECVHDPIVV